VLISDEHKLLFEGSKKGFVKNTNTPTQQHNNTTTQQHNNTTTQQHNNTTTQQHNNTTTQNESNLAWPRKRGPWRLPLVLTCLVCPVPNTYVGMQSCIPAMMW
jgi:hypothetical protein